MTEMLVGSWMTHDVISITGDCLLPEAYCLMKNHAIRHLPVLEDGKLVGVVSWGDVRQAVATGPRAISNHDPYCDLIERPVTEIMSRDPITVSPDTSMVQAAQIMVEKEIGGLPVTDAGNLTGIVTECDIFRMMILYQTV